MEKTTAILAGISAEYFVAAELSRRGFTASITLKNTKGIDVLVIDPSMAQIKGIQVKSKQELGKTKKWLLKESDEAFNENNFFYAFVDLKMKSGGLPDIYLVPAKTVSVELKRNHKEFLAKGGKDSDMREYKLDDKKYLNNWDILKC